MKAIRISDEVYEMLIEKAKQDKRTIKATADIAITAMVGGKIPKCPKTPVSASRKGE